MNCKSRLWLTDSDSVPVCDGASVSFTLALRTLDASFTAIPIFSISTEKASPSQDAHRSAYLKVVDTALHQLRLPSGGFACPDGAMHIRDVKLEIQAFVRRALHATSFHHKPWQILPERETPFIFPRYGQQIS